MTKSEVKLSGLEVRIGQLNMEKLEQAEDIRALKLQYNELLSTIDGHKADKMFLRNQVEELNEESKEKDHTIMSLSHTICEKGETNRRLIEIINTFKNQLIQDKIFE